MPQPSPDRAAPLDRERQPGDRPQRPGRQAEVAPVALGGAILPASSGAGPRCRRSVGTSHRPHQKTRSTSRPESAKAVAQPLRQVSAPMPLDPSNSPNIVRQGRDADHDVPTGSRQAREAAHGRSVVVEVLDHVQGQDRVMGRRRLSSIGRVRSASIRRRPGPVELLQRPARDVHAGRLDSRAPPGASSVTPQPQPTSRTRAGGRKPRSRSRSSVSAARARHHGWRRMIAARSTRISSGMCSSASPCDQRSIIAFGPARSARHAAARGRRGPRRGGASDPRRCRSVVSSLPGR